MILTWLNKPISRIIEREGGVAPNVADWGVAALADPAGQQKTTAFVRINDVEAFERSMPDGWVRTLYMAFKEGAREPQTLAAE